MPAGVVVVDRGGREHRAQLSAFTQGTFSRRRYNIIHAQIIFRRPYAISAGCFSSVTPCRVLSTSTKCNIIHAVLPFRRPYAISARFIKPDRKLPRLFADAGTWFRNETLVSAASATKRECADGRILSGDLPNESVPAEVFHPASIRRLFL